MTTLRAYRGVDELLDRIEAVRFRAWVLRVLTGALIVTGVLCAALLVAGLAAGYWPDQPPRLLRWSLLIGSFGALLGALGLWALRGWLWRQKPAQTARAIEQAMPEARNDLINSVLLADDAQQTSPELVQLAIGESLARTRRLELKRSVSLRPLKRAALLAGLSAVLMTTFAAFQPGPFRRGVMATLTPGSYVARANDVELMVLEPGDATVFAGEPLTLVARIRNDAHEPLEAEVLSPGSAPRRMIASDGYTSFTLPLGKMDRELRYAVRIGRSRWPEDREWYTVKVRRRVEVAGLDHRYEYPRYTHKASEPVADAAGPIAVPLGTAVELTLRLRTPAPRALLEFRNGKTVPLGVLGDGRSFTGRFVVREDAGYRIVLKDPSGAVVGQLPDAGNREIRDLYAAGSDELIKGYYPVRALPDARPTVEVLSPRRNVTVSPGGELPLRIKATDRYGVTALRLYTALERGDEPPKFLPEPTFVDPVSGERKEIVHDWTFDLSRFKEGDTIVYYARATDNRDLASIGVGGPQHKDSYQYKITLRDAAKLAAERAKLYDEIRRRLLAILRLQTTARFKCLQCRTQHKTLDAINAAGGEIQTLQKQIRADLLDLVENVTFDAEMASIQQECALLGNNEARTAIDQAQVLATLGGLVERNRATGVLGRTQEDIINKLQNLLAIMPSLANKPDRKKTAPGEDLPPETQEKLRALRDRMKEFVAEQKKVIEATKRLAKKPADAFTAEDEKLLKELAAVEDKWEKFINEAVTDLSKLAQQDFSDPAMLKEMISVKCDVTMAKDALKAKAKEIAVAAEEGGAENAESVTANIEKWLPDKPDREKWSMEDPTGGQDKIEQAELPTELEDLVGDLLEQEEDLFEEMDDVTSKAAMSGDKGIGWDATDGPISNMNAQGVTGNQLPNTSEISGRSGEGRTGKSSGEFVEDKAVGKGGRKTPTRLTPDPFQKGEVNDASKEPPGGATGGGKVSGSGQEGLEGPVPAPLEKEMKRLASKQAAIINRAERIKGRFSPGTYANFKFLEAITLMNKVKSDLENNRYRNVLRQREAMLGTLKQSKLLLAGEVEIEQDTSSGMPKYIREDIADAMNQKRPAEYRAVLDQYYKRLSGGGTQ